MCDNTERQRVYIYMKDTQVLLNKKMPGASFATESEREVEKNNLEVSPPFSHDMTTLR